MANISIDVADNEARKDLQDLEDYVDSAAFDKQSLSVTENGTYTAPAGKAYSPVVVDVPNTYAQSDEGKVVSSGALVSQTTRNVTTNGTYDTTTNNSVVVDVQEQPWQPLEDGYSNFWFELTNDTLSPWLNFSAKNADAVIDWGDGSGEVALDTLTPTHTYSKAGRYVVKVKGVTGIGKQHEILPRTPYIKCLVAIELNSDVYYTENLTFQWCIRLKHVACNVNAISSGNLLSYCPYLEDVSFSDNISYMYGNVFMYDYNLNTVRLPAGLTILKGGTFTYCISLNSLTIPNHVSEIERNAFNYCSALTEIHIQATTPPTLGANVFEILPSDFIIYVPVGTGETYKAAAGWSAYSDHILEEGQTPNRAMQTNFTQNDQNE